MSELTDLPEYREQQAATTGVKALVERLRAKLSNGSVDDRITIWVDREGIEVHYDRLCSSRELLALADAYETAVRERDLSDGTSRTVVEGGKDLALEISKLISERDGANKIASAAKFQNERLVEKVQQSHAREERLATAAKTVSDYGWGSIGILRDALAEYDRERSKR